MNYIQQVNKGGTFVGSNKLKHMTTGMMEIRFVDQITQDERYVVFSKNLRGHVGKQMFFNLAATRDVTYDTERFKKSESLKQLKKKEKLFLTIRNDDDAMVREIIDNNPEFLEKIILEALQVLGHNQNPWR